MEELRSLIRLSLRTLETELFSLLRALFVEIFVMVLQELDALIAAALDPRRYEAKSLQGRTLQTLFGTVSFRRRRFYDHREKRWVYPLDELLEFPDRQQVSPGLVSWGLVQAMLTGSYRAAARSLKEIYGYPVISHESIRQLAVATGLELEKRKEEQLADPQGTRKVKYLFLEVDGLVVSLQRQKRRRIEEKLLTVHEGWEPRHPSSNEYELVNKRHFRTQDADFWEAASRFVYALYDVDEDTVVIINGDRAPWIRRGVGYFPRVLYQVDPFHLKRDLVRIFGKKHPVLSKLEEARQSDVTGAAFLARLAEAVAELKDAKKRQDGEALLKDLVDIPEAVVDYRVRLQAMGLDTEGLRGMGAAESQVDTFADRVKGRGRSWSPRGLAAMMELLCWRNTDALPQMLAQVEELLARTGVSLQQVKEHAVQRARRVICEGLSVPSAGVPATRRGRTATGGMSWWLNRLISGTAG